jgi:hypothetical protein
MSEEYLADPAWEDSERIALFIRAVLDQANYTRDDLDEIVNLIRELHPGH